MLLEPVPRVLWGPLLRARAGGLNGRSWSVPLSAPPQGGTGSRAGENHLWHCSAAAHPQKEGSANVRLRRRGQGDPSTNVVLNKALSARLQEVIAPPQPQPRRAPSHPGARGHAGDGEGATGGRAKTREMEIPRGLTAVAEEAAIRGCVDPTTELALTSAQVGEHGQEHPDHRGSFTASSARPRGRPGGWRGGRPAMPRLCSNRYLEQPFLSAVRAGRVLPSTMPPFWIGTGSAAGGALFMDHVLYGPPPPPEPPQLTRIRLARPRIIYATARAEGWTSPLARLTRWTGPGAQA